MAKDLAIILNSGSINSAVVTALAAQKYRPIMLFAETSGSPGSRARAAFDQQVAHFKPYREQMISMSFLSALHASSTVATAAADPRQGGLLGPQLLDLLPLISAAARFGAHYQAAAIYAGIRIGSSAEELAQATEYIQILNELIQLPCALPELEMMTPLLELEPWQVVDLGFQVSAPLERAWSCAEETTDACGTCRGCRARDAAFLQAGKPDPARVIKRL